MYIALEGIKGSGKSSIIQNIMGSPLGRITSLFPITEMAKADTISERMLSAMPELKTDDSFMEKLFLNRAIYNNGKVDIHKPLILGDRSILTAYVTRWEKWKDPGYAIKRIEQQYKNVRKPDVIVFMENTVQKSILNIAGRKQKTTGQQDEKYESLALADSIYRMLLLEGEYRRKIGRAQVIRLQAGAELDLITTEINNILKYYAKK